MRPKCKRGNPYSELTADPAERRCPHCKMKLWPRAPPRRIRFHDLQHSAATLMLRARAWTRTPCSEFSGIPI